MTVGAYEVTLSKFSQDQFESTLHRMTNLKQFI
jgi:hypothetical protein